ncbi:DNA-directed DNA polymerase alpha catalytic subunit pol1 [Tulasnella sp. 418]|nr:DNA-directed DNA polymerase alpha catalytic subunit pol1 [Tulasnella sp. 418]
MDGGEKKTATKKVKKEEDFDFGDDEFDDIDFGNLQFDSAGKMVDDTKKPIPKSNYQHPTSTKTDITKIKKLDDSQTPAWLAIKDALQANTIVDTSAEFDSLGPLKTSESSTSQVNTEAILEEDGSLRFFWLDYLELGGRVYLVGKALERNPNGNGGRWVSCCVTVNGIERNLFCKPRQWALDEYDEETDVVPTEKAIRGDFDKLRKEHKVGGFGGKMVERRHVFDEPGDGDKGGKTKYYKVVYGFDQPQIPIDSSTPNIERIYGTNTSAFEMLVIKRKIMGPCWLEVKNPEVSNKGISWCKLEVEVSDPKELGPFAETDAQAPRDMPPLTVMSFSLRTIINHLSNQREIVCATARFWEDVNVEEAMAPERLPSAVHTVVRCLDKFPVRFEEQARAERSKIVTMTQEKALLSSLLAMIKKYDPDVIVGHEFAGVSLDILLHRLKQLKVEPWSCVGRFKRAKWPPIGKQGTNMKFLNGRLMCDLSSDAGKSMITSTTWSLTEMSSGHLGITREDIDPEDTATFFDSTVSSPDRLMSFVRHCERDAYLQMAIATKVQMLALTKQLTNLAGNAWNKTLNGGRAERNEYILLHEFHRLKYICPDKTYGKKASTAAARAEAQEGEANDGAAVGTTTKGKKDKYKGGLVFEPKRGLWDKYILVMDFNSLYPSIIQEYNIDFTTVVKEVIEVGREILTHTRELAESLSLDVVYGDTDSVFVNSNADNFPDALKMANMFKKQVNNRYKLLEIDLDGVFQRVLLLQKKKYAAVKVKGPNETTIEVKGLDMKRREYSALSKNVSKKVLDFILSGQPTEEVVEEIHEYLRSVGTSVRDGKVTLEDLTIFKRLGKDPEAYPDAKSQPHVQVALRMKSRGGTAKAGDVIPYLFCLGPDGQSSKTAQADRARHPDEVRRGGDDVKIDYEFYLSQQVLPPIERLCDPIAGTDRSRIAECLGMDPSKFQTYNSSNSQEVEFTTLESLIPDKERFKDVDLFLVKCKKCEGTYEFTAVGNVENPIMTSSGVHCPSCSHTLTGPRALALLELQIRQHISRYYDSWTICDEQTCQSRTRSMNVYGRRCLQPECGGSVRMEVCNLCLIFVSWLIVLSTVYESPVVQSITVLCIIVQRHQGFE